jgi:hypothetical protein
MHDITRWQLHIITVHTWTAVFLKRLANTSFMASFRAKTEPHSVLSLQACILLQRPARYLAVYCNGSSFTPSTFCYLDGFSLMYTKTSQQPYMTHGTHVCIYITLALLFTSSSDTSSILLGRLAVPVSGRACIWNGEPLGEGEKGMGSKGGGGEVSIQPSRDLSGWESHHAKGGISK